MRKCRNTGADLSERFSCDPGLSGSNRSKVAFTWFTTRKWSMSKGGTGDRQHFRAMGSCLREQCEQEDAKKKLLRW